MIFCIAMLCCLQIIAALAWMAVGEEIIRLMPGRLETGYRLLGVERMRSTPIEDVCYLATWHDNPSSYPACPIGGCLAHGAIKFETPERTIFFAAALEEEEAQQVVDYLLWRWPPELRG